MQYPALMEDDDDDDSRASLIAAALEWAPHADAASASTYFYNTRTGDLSMTEPDAWTQARAVGWCPASIPDSAAPAPSASAPASAPVAHDQTAAAAAAAASPSEPVSALSATAEAGGDGGDSAAIDATGHAADQSSAAENKTHQDPAKSTSTSANEVEDADEPLGEHILRRLPDGWYECEDPNSKLVYFWNRHSNAVQWNAPGIVEPFQFAPS